MFTTLVVTQDDSLASVVEMAAAKIEGCRVHRVDSVLDHTTVVDESVYLVVLHHQSEDALSDAQLRHLADKRSGAPVILICDRYDAEQELRTLRAGVCDCLTRPVDVRRLTQLIESATLSRRLEARRRGDGAASRLRACYRDSSPPMRRILDHVGRLGSKQVPILLGGETGTGKTFLAKLIHATSSRAAQPFVSINCGGLPPDLIESELFGHKKGAFTGACDDREGKFSCAAAGTILLDEVDAMTHSAQAKLLRVLDERVYERLGSNESLPLRARIIAASNRSLEQAAANGEFRSDLFYRLSVIQLNVPPLRERVSEVRPLVLYFLNELAPLHDMPVPRVESSVWDLLESHDWPGNIRELRNAVEYAVTLCDGNVLSVGDLPQRFSQLPPAKSKAIAPEDAAHREIAGGGNGLARARKEGEYRRLLDVLKSCRDNRSQAAKALGISRAALYKKLAAYGVDRLATPYSGLDPSADLSDSSLS